MKKISGKKGTAEKGTAEKSAALEINPLAKMLQIRALASLLGLLLGLSLPLAVVGFFFSLSPLLALAGTLAFISVVGIVLTFSKLNKTREELRAYLRKEAEELYGLPPKT